MESKKIIDNTEFYHKVKLTSETCFNLVSEEIATILNLAIQHGLVSPPIYVARAKKNEYKLLPHLMWESLEEDNEWMAFEHFKGQTIEQD